MLAHKLIEKYLSNNNVDYFAYERYSNNERNPYHLINILLNDGTDVLFKISFNYNSTDVYDEMRYRLSIYNDLSGRMVKTYSNNNLGYEDILRKVMRYKDKFKVIDGNEIIKESGVINICGSDIRSMVSECIRRLLTEDQGAKSISEAIKLFMDFTNCDKVYAEYWVRNKVRGTVPILRTKIGSKFILGITRLMLEPYFDRKYATSVIKAIIANNHVNEYDRNLNGMSLRKLLWVLKDDIETTRQNERNGVNSINYAENINYKIVRIDSFEEAKEYGNYTTWCITHDMGMFDSYTNYGDNQFYFCLQNGFENIERSSGENAPLDEYGLSMIAVCVNEDGDLETCTCRWNHDNGGNDEILDTSEISKLIGRNFYSVFKPNNNWEETKNNIISELNSGKRLSDIFDYVGDDSEHCGVINVGINSRYNYVVSLKIGERKLLSEEWFECAYKFKGGYGLIKNKYGNNFIDINGNFLFKEWYDIQDYFYEGFSVIRDGNKYNFLSKDEKILCDDWYNNAYSFDGGCARVDNGHGMNIIDTNGNILSKEWYEDIGEMSCGLMLVKKHSYKYNFMDNKGNIRFKTWFQRSMPFVKSTNKTFVDLYKDNVFRSLIIDTNGNIFSSEGVVIGKIE